MAVQLTRGRVVGGVYEVDYRPSLKLDKNIRYVYEKFGARPLFVDEDGNGAPTGSGGDVNICRTEDYGFEYAAIGTQTDVLLGWNASKGLDLIQDATSGDGNELTLGLGSKSRGAFTAQTDACYFKAQIELTDVSGFAEMAVGFRKNSAYNETIDDYTDMAAFNIQAGVINIETILNNAATDTTDTTLTDWIDDATHTLEVRVNSSGQVTFLYDGSAPTVVPSTFTFDSGDVIVPFIHQTLGASAANGCFVKLWESGLDHELPAS